MTHPRDKYDYAEDLIERVAKQHGKTWLQVKGDACAANGDDSFRRKLNRAKKQGWATAQTFKALADTIGCEISDLIKDSASVSTIPSNYMSELASFNLDFFQSTNILGDIFSLSISVENDQNSTPLDWPFEIAPRRLVLEFESKAHVAIYLSPEVNSNLEGFKINHISHNRFEIVSTTRDLPLPYGMIIGPETELFRASWQSDDRAPIHAFLGLTNEMDLIPELPEMDTNLNFQYARRLAIQIMKNRISTLQNQIKATDKISVLLSHQTILIEKLDAIHENF